MSFPLWKRVKAGHAANKHARRTIRQTLDHRRSLRTSFECLEQKAMLTMLTPMSFSAGTNLSGIAVADFNGDGKSDIAVVNNAVAGSVGILISNGDGTFQPKVDYAAGTNPLDARAGDINADGKIDLSVVSPSGTVNILLGNGDGSFAVPVSYATGLGARAIVVGDFNHDGKFDVATMNSGTASVLLGNGDGTFQAHKDAVFVGNTNMIAGDFNHDGNLDLATSNTLSVGTITLLRGHGDGTFDPEININANSAPVYLADGDFNHDGYDDFAVANSYSATSMSVILNNGDGTYAPPTLYSIAQTGYEIEVADFNNDGFQDFAVRGASQYQIEYGKGDGTFYTAVNFATPPGQFEKGSQHGDFNGDGAIDLTYVSSAGVTVVMNANDSAANLAGAVGFMVTTPASTTSGSALPMTVTAADAAGNPVTGFLGTVFVTTNDPAVKSTFAYTFTTADAGAHAFTGSVQLVTLGDQTVTVASPLMTSATRTVTVTPAVNHFAIAAPTATTAGDTFNVTVSAIDQLGGVGTGYTSTVHFSSSDVQAGLPADYTFTGTDAGVHTFTATLKTAGSKFLSATELGGTITGVASVSVNPIAAASLALAGGSGSIGIARLITIVARDIYGNVDTACNGVVHVTSSDLLAVLPADTTLVKGVATVDITLMTVGTQTITATDVSSPLTGTMSSDATPPVASSFDVAGYPATKAGVVHDFTVTVRDTIGQIATGYTGTVYFSSTDVQSGLPSSYTFTTADTGVHTFNATFRSAGIQSLNVRDFTGALVGSEMGISVSSAEFVGYRLSIQIATDSHGHYLMTAGDLIPLTVKAMDVFGNAVNDYTGTAHFSSTDVQASLPADYTFTAADSGVHTFTVILKTTTGNGVVWSFNVVDSANAATLATLTNFEVVNAAASTFGITVPSQITAGATFTSKLTVSDAYGNGVKNYFGLVHFSTSAALAGLPADYTFNSADAGSHTFTLTLNTSGNQTLSVVDINNSLLTASAAASVKAATASTLVAVFPTRTLLGVAQSLTVTAKDAFGNLSTGYTGTVAFSSSDAQAGLPGHYAFSNKDAGVHTFNVTLKAAGIQSITVQDTTAATLKASVSEIMVAISNSPTALSFTAGSGSGTYGGTTRATVTLTSTGLPLANMTVGFALNGASVGTATTSESGVATLGGISLAGLNVGAYPSSLVATFAGNETYVSSAATADVAVSQAVTTINSSQTVGSLAVSGNSTVMIGSGGDLAVTSPVSFNSGGAVSVAQNGRISLPAINTQSDAIGIDFNSGTLRASAGFSTIVPFTMGVGGGTIDSNGQDLVLAGPLIGVGSLTKTGPGILTLSGANTYAGGTIVSAGTLMVTNASALPSGMSLTVGLAAALAFAPSPGIVSGGAASVNAAPVAARSASAALVASKPTAASFSASGSLAMSATVFASESAGGTVVRPSATVATPQATPPVQASTFASPRKTVAPSAAARMSNAIAMDRFLRPSTIVESTARNLTWLRHSDNGSSDPTQRNKKVASILALDAVFAQYHK
jgi:autotransporter-associated beta strand protein